VGQVEPAGFNLERRPWYKGDMSLSKHLRDLVSHRVTFDYENGCHITGYVATVRPAEGEVLTIVLSHVEVSNDAGDVIERHREMVVVPSVLTNYRQTEGPSARARL
jgi:recombinational DNA repair protein RecT